MAAQFNQGAPTVPVVLNTSNCFVFGNTASGNALSVQQFGTGSVARFRTTTGATAMFVNAAGSVGIGTITPSTALHVVGQTISTTAVFLMTLLSVSITYYNSSGVSVTPNTTGQYYYVVMGTSTGRSINWTPSYTNGSRLTIPYSGLYTITWGIPAWSGPVPVEYFITRNSGAGNDLNDTGGNLLALSNDASTTQEFTLNTTAYFAANDFMNIGFYYGGGSGTYNPATRMLLTVALIQRTA